MGDHERGTGSKHFQQALLTYHSRLEPALPPAPPDGVTPRAWNSVIREFLSATGLTQAMHGFDADMVVMNPSFERDVVPLALANLLDSLVVS